MLVGKAKHLRTRHHRRDIDSPNCFCSWVCSCAGKCLFMVHAAYTSSCKDNKKRSCPTKSTDSRYEMNCAILEQLEMGGCNMCFPNDQVSLKVTVSFPKNLGNQVISASASSRKLPPGLLAAGASLKEHKLSYIPRSFLLLVSC